MMQTLMLTKWTRTVSEGTGWGGARRSGGWVGVR